MIVSFISRTAIGRFITLLAEVMRDAYDMKAQHDRRYTSRDA